MPITVRCRYCNRRFEVTNAGSPVPEHTVSRLEDIRCPGSLAPGHLVPTASPGAG